MSSLKVRLAFRLFCARCWVANTREKAWMAIAWRLPKVLVKWAAVRLMAHATMGEHSQHPDTVSILDALKRWPD